MAFPISPVFQALSQIKGTFAPVLGPVSDAGWRRMRSAIGLSDAAVSRQVEQEQQRAAVGWTKVYTGGNIFLGPREFVWRQDGRGGKGYANTIPDPQSLIAQLHRSPIVDLGASTGLPDSTWVWLKDRLASHGYDLALPGEAAPPAGAKDWLEIVRMQAAAAPLDAALTAWFRRRGGEPVARDRARAELDFHFRRGGYSRAGDRELIEKPWYKWSSRDAQRLRWSGVIEFTDYLNLIAGAGMVRDEDVAYQDILSQLYPSPTTLADWSISKAWDQEFADRWGLDDDIDRDPIARFLARSQGFGYPNTPLPGQPDVTTDWYKLNWRASRQMPGFGQAAQMQHRLRPRPDSPADSVVRGAPSWSAADTREMLQIEGYTKPMIERLMGLVFEPLNIRLLNHILGPYSTHEEVREAADAAFGVGVNWVENAMLDHGFSPAYAKVAAVGIQAQADDRDMAERKEAEKAYRAARRKLAERAYVAGILDAPAARERMIDKFFTDAMAVQQLELLDNELEVTQKENILTAIKAAYMDGKIDLGQMGAQFQALGITTARRIYYTQEWTWERSDRSRMLTTGEILKALKTGLMTPAIATQRLINLGWTAPDALVEIAQVMHDVETAQAHAASSAVAKQVSSTQAAQRKLAAEQKTVATAQARAAREAKARADKLAGVATEQVAAAATYEAAALLDRIAYEKAAAKGNTDAMQAEIDKATAAYAKLLTKQLHLSQIGPEAASEIEEVEPVPIPNPDAGAGAGQDAGGAASQSGPAPEPGSGNAAAPPVG